MANSDAGEIRKGIALLLVPGRLYELRIPRFGSLGTVAGRYDDFERLASLGNNCPKGQFKMPTKTKLKAYSPQYGRA